MTPCPRQLFAHDQQLCGRGNAIGAPLADPVLRLVCRGWDHLAGDYPGRVLRWITAFLDLPAEAASLGVEFWRAVTGSNVSARRGERSQFVTLLPSDGDPYLRVQATLGGHAGCHLDLHADEPDEIAERALSLGAVERCREPGLAVLESPGGLGFCAVRHGGEGTRPSPVVRGDAGRSLSILPATTSGPRP
jgi:Glyoxalase-like domain